MEYAVVVQTSHLNICLNLFDLEVCRSIHIVVTHPFVTVCYGTTIENQRKFTYLNKETREIVKNLCENGMSILAVVQICGVHRTNMWTIITAKTE